MQGESKWLAERARREGAMVLYAHGGLGSACRRWKRFVGLGSSQGMASWTKSSGVSAGLERVLCQWAQARVQ
jgi:hypothetical protein